MKQTIRRDVENLDGIKVLNISNFSLSRSASSTFPWVSRSDIQIYIQNWSLHSSYDISYTAHMKEMKNACTIFFSENLKDRKDHSTDLGIDERIKLK
jgi:hypothetical protein